MTTVPYSKFYAKLLADIIEDDKIQVVHQYYTKTTAVDGLRILPKRTFKKLVRDLDISIIQLEQLSSDKFASYISFNVYGCPYSTDIDVALQMKNKEDLVKPLSISERKRLETDLQECGYDINTRDLDINIIYVNEDGNLEGVSKGSNETQNIMYFTYNHHKQIHKRIVSNQIHINPYDKVRAIAKFILDRMNILLYVDYDEDKKLEKRHVYARGGWSIIEYTIGLFDKFNNSNYTHKKWKDVWKSLTMKYIQLSLLDQEKYVYTKEGLVSAWDKSHPGHGEHVFNLLFRKCDKVPTCCMKLMHDNYCKLSEKYRPVQLNFVHHLNKLNPGLMSDTLFYEFVTSPLEASDIFIEEWVKLYGDDVGSVNNKFEEKVMNVHLIPTELKSRVILENPRSKEWLQLLKDYTCGRNTGVKPLPERCNASTEIKMRYNLIRGIVVEDMVITHFPFEELVGIHEKISVGMIVKDLKKGSLGCCPDLLLLVKDDTGRAYLIPVEIKCLVGRPRDTGDFLRGIQLATSQINRCNDIINDDIKKGVVVLVWTYLNDEGESVYEAHGGVI